MTAEGRQMGVYRLRERIGAGGMGEVYRASDSRLGRDVAIKILPPSLSTAAGYRERFEREARVLAALNHPNIAAIYGAEDTTDGGPPLHGLVLELVDGETLRDRIARGPLAVKDALTIAVRVADALESAHDTGIIHRDLKPANIRITPAGVVKVLDFGLAKVINAALSSSTPTSEATIAASVTAAGTILGTAAYMSPEHARGEMVDKQTDVWAFGCLLYEMLTARPAFGRSSMMETLAAINEGHPDWSALPRTTPPGVTRLLQRCLEKDLRRRAHAIADVRTELEDALVSSPSGYRTVARPVPVIPRRMVVTAAVILAAAAVLGWFATRPEPEENAVRLSISVPGTLTPQTSVAVSPDGRQLAYVSTDQSGRSRLWVRELDSLEPRVLSGTEDAAHPLWSPDGRSLAFLAGGKLKRIDLAGGALLTLADTNTRNGATWGRSGLILFSPRAGQFATVPAGGGAVSPVLTRSGAGWPSFLPDGRRFLFVVSANSPDSGVYLGSLDSDATTRLNEAEYKGAYAAPGYLLFVRGETLMAQPFEPDRRAVTGDPVPVAEGVWGGRLVAQASYSVSDTGVLAYVNSSLMNRELMWFTRAGRSLGSLGQPDRYHATPELSPDGSRVAIARGAGNQDVWVINVADQSPARATFGPASATVPKWSADGRRILYASAEQAALTLLSIDAGGRETPRSMGTIPWRVPGNAYLWDWSRDGRFVVYSTIGPHLAADLWVLPLAGDRTPRAFAESRFHKTQAQISPNGRWLAYTSYESGRDEVYVESFPTPGGKRQISTDGGMQPRWRYDGRELFYLRNDQYMMVVPLTADQTPAAAPTPLFRTRLLPQGSQSIWFDTAYDVTPDGQRFLLTDAPTAPSPPITVVLNWRAAMRK